MKRLLASFLFASQFEWFGKEIFFTDLIKSLQSPPLKLQKLVVAATDEEKKKLKIYAPTVQSTGLHLQVQLVKCREDECLIHSGSLRFSRTVHWRCDEES
jgi:hypothetical protein